MMLYKGREVALGVELGLDAAVACLDVQDELASVVVSIEHIHLLVSTQGVDQYFAVSAHVEDEMGV